jgi:predicted RNA-binding Zn-ribbon protein involved in translation (DUF1610 family)
MNYTRIYNELISKGKNRILEGYHEIHHIIPRCMGGDNSSDNLVNLTPEEHYIAHLLLVKMYPDNKSLVYAANMMANFNNKQYAWTKNLHSNNVSKQFTGYKHTEEAKYKMKLAIAERWQGKEAEFAEEQKRRATTPKKKKDGYFKPKSENHAKNISIGARTKRVRHVCPNCATLITTANLKKHIGSKLCQSLTQKTKQTILAV